MEPSTPKTSPLMDLAQERFGELSDNSIKLIKAAENGVSESYIDEVIDGDVLTWLCCKKEAQELVHRKGVRIKNATIEDKLDFSFTNIPFPLWISQSKILKPFTLKQATIPELSLIGSHTQSIHADNIDVKGDVFLRNEFKAEGEVRFQSAKIGSNFECDNSSFSNPFEVAINADNIEVKGSVFLRNGFKTEGEVRFHSAKICTSFDCENGSFSNPDGKAIHADSIEVNGNVFLLNEFKAEGEVRFHSAKIGNNFECDNSSFSNSGYSIHAESIEVKGNVFLRSEFKAEGTINFLSAKINDHLVITDINTIQYLQIDLRSCHANNLWDDPNKWQDNISVNLDGFTYNRINANAPTKAIERMAWLSREVSDEYLPQPYEQLAKVLRQDGHEEDAKKILIEKAKQKGIKTKMSRLEKLMHIISGFLIDYGYHPFKAVRYGGYCVLFGMVMFFLAYQFNFMMKRDFAFDTTYPSCNIEKPYPSFYSFVYAVDVFTPLVDLHQAKYYTPDSSTWIGLGFLIIFWLEIVAGWLLTTFFVAGISGLVRI